MKSKSIPSFRIGNIVSGERNVKDEADREQLRIAFNAFACNWEAAAVLKTAALNGILSLSIRGITACVLLLDGGLKGKVHFAFLHMYPR
jgi:nucleoside phosphorylase